MEEKRRIIPHNYKNNGRVFNLFSKRGLTKALCYLAPVVLIIFNLPIDVDNKFFFAIIFGGPPAAAFCLEYDVMIMDILLYKKNKRVYYDLGKEGTAYDRNYQAAYEQEKLAKASGD